MLSEARFRAYIAFKKQNMHLHLYGLKTLQMALEGTKYELFTKYYTSHNIMLFNPEPTIKPILKIVKKFPQMILLCKFPSILLLYFLSCIFLAGIYEGKYLSKDELLAISEIPNLQAAQSQLVHVLQSAGGGLVRNLTQCQNTLVQHLQERTKQLEEKS